VSRPFLSFVGVASIVFGILARPAAAQWIEHPTPGLPRAADGSPDLTRPSPRLPGGPPDLSGMWRLEMDANLTTLLEAAGVQEWARARHEKYMYELGRDDPAVHCLPLGPRSSLTFGFAAKFIHTPGLLVILYEDLTYRQIFLDGRDLPRDPNPTWMGYSVGRWEGDALIVSSLGYNDRSLLDFEGHPHTEALRITERFRRRDFGHMDVQVTIEDPQTVAKPVVIPLHADFVPDTELLEYVCQENERSRQRMIGTADDDKKLQVAVAADVLARYVGTYRLQMPEGPPRRLTVYLQDGQVTMDIEGGTTITAIPVSQTRFLAQGVAVEFFPGPDGVATGLLVSIVEGDLKGVRIP
jgi:hypothetical protein